MRTGKTVVLSDYTDGYGHYTPQGATRYLLTLSTGNGAVNRRMENDPLWSPDTLILTLKIYPGNGNANEFLRLPESIDTYYNALITKHSREPEDALFDAFKKYHAIESVFEQLGRTNVFLKQYLGLPEEYNCNSAFIRNYNEEKSSNALISRELMGQNQQKNNAEAPLPQQFMYREQPSSISSFEAIDIDVVWIGLSRELRIDTDLWLTFPDHSSEMVEQRIPYVNRICRALVSLEPCSDTYSEGHYDFDGKGEDYVLYEFSKSTSENNIVNRLNQDLKNKHRFNKLKKYLLDNVYFSQQEEMLDKNIFQFLEALHRHL